MHSRMTRSPCSGKRLREAPICQRVTQGGMPKVSYLAPRDTVYFIVRDDPRRAPLRRRSRKKKLSLAPPRARALEPRESALRIHRAISVAPLGRRWLCRASLSERARIKAGGGAVSPMRPHRGESEKWRERERRAGREPAGDAQTAKSEENAARRGSTMQAIIARERQQMKDQT